MTTPPRRRALDLRPSRVLVGVLACVAVSAAGPAAAPAGARTPDRAPAVASAQPGVEHRPAQGAASTAARQRRGVLRLTNAARERHDLRALRPRSCLDRVAQRWARHMARTGNLVHRDFDRVQAACGRRFAGGENIATGFSTPRLVVRAWLGSEGHRANILRPAHDAVGTGAFRDRDGRWWWVQDFADLR